MTRRVFHYSNEEHGAIVAWLNGPAGLEAFDKDLEKYLPPLPKKTPREAVKGVEFPRNVALENAIAKIPMKKGGTRIFFPIGPGASQEAMEALIPVAKQSQDGVEVHVLVNGISERVFQDGVDKAGDKFRIHALFLGGNLRRLHSEGRVHVVPGFLGDFSRHARNPERPEFKYDAIVVRVSPADAYGRHSLGPNCDHVMTLLEANPEMTIIAEVNPNVPFTTGENFISRDRITASFPSTGSLPNPSAVEKTPVEEKIGEYLGELIPNGATLQVGIGNVFGGLADGLEKAGRKNLRISTEMMGDDVMSLIERGIAADAETSFAFGSGDFYRKLHRNPHVIFKSTEYLNDPSRIAATPRFVALNTAIQVNLFGEVNATMGPADRGRISSVGGQVEFMSGAARSDGGRAIIAMRSTAKNGTQSTIALDLYRGPITTPHELVSHVVTEYGVAELWGKTEAGRAMALLNVAHPKFRESLFNEAVARRIVPESERKNLRQFDPDVAAAPVVREGQLGLLETARRENVPAYLRNVGGGKQLPVFLLNQQTYPALKPFLDQSISTGVKMFPFDNRGTDHGLIRLGDSVIDYYWPGSDKFGQLHQSGVFWLHVPEYLKRRNPNSERIVEALYSLTPEERATAEYYHRVRRAGVFKSRYEFSAWDGIYNGKPHVLNRGFENCYAFGVNERTQDHIDDMKHQLGELGVADPEALMKDPLVIDFIARARARILNVVRYDREGKVIAPEVEAQVMSARMFDVLATAPLLALAPKAINAEDRTRFLSYVVGIDASRQYQELGKTLGLNGHFWNFSSPRATAIIVWDSENAAEAFRQGHYEEGGGNPAYQLRDRSLNRALRP